MNAATILHRFSADFGVPFLMGKKCLIADPLGKPGFLAIRHGLGIDVNLKDACDAQFTEAALLGDVTPAPFDHDAATLLYATHDLFATTHPQAASFYARTHLFAKAAANEVNLLPRTLDPGLLITRHLIVRRAFKTARTDVHVKWWTGNASFYGEDPPWRLTQWPSMRRVQQNRLTQPMWRLAMQGGDEELRVARLALMVALLDASPLTRLMMAGDPVQRNLGFSLILPYKINGRKASPLDVLEDKRIARIVTDSLLHDGLDTGGAVLALALLQGLREGASPLVLRRTAELCTHMALMACLVEGEAPGAPESKRLVAFVDGDPAVLNDPASRAYWVLVSATLMLGGEGGSIELPNFADLPPSAFAVLERLRVRLRDKQIAERADPLMRELGKRLPRLQSSLPSFPTAGLLPPAPEAATTTAAPAGPDPPLDINLDL
ncbi:MAG: hypothetical protein Q8O67_14115 [Deltaproteobacteria bacterium]|nr:hypothetical protein [Deltaproteobacteria bacterium]